MRNLKRILLPGCYLAVAAMVNASPLVIDPQPSKVEVAVSSTIDSFVGHLDKYQATIECDSKADLPTQAEVDFDFADLKTGNTSRDASMLQWLQYDTHRTAAFHLTGWQQDGTTNIAVGDLTFHGATQVVRMPVVIRHDDAGWDISGHTVVNYKDFNLPIIRKAFFLTVDPQLDIRFHLVGKLSTAK